MCAVDHPHFRMLRGEPVEDLSRFIATAVVDQQYVEIGIGRCEQVLDGVFDIAPLIMTRNDDCHQRMQG